jgi:hypothetical protein
MFIISANFIRDLVTMLLEIVFNISLIILLKKYVARRNRIISTRSNENNNNNTELKNGAIALILCSFSTVIHAATFSVYFFNSAHDFYFIFLPMIFILFHIIKFSQIFLIFIYANDLNLSVTVSFSNALLNSTKHALNLLIFWILNKKFRTGLKVVLDNFSTTFD